MRRAMRRFLCAALVFAVCVLALTSRRLQQIRGSAAPRPLHGDTPAPALGGRRPVASSVASVAPVARSIQKVAGATDDDVFDRIALASHTERVVCASVGPDLLPAQWAPSRRCAAVAAPPPQQRSGAGDGFLTFDAERGIGKQHASAEKMHSHGASMRRLATAQLLKSAAQYPTAIAALLETAGSRSSGPALPAVVASCDGSSIVVVDGLAGADTVALSAAGRRAAADAWRAVTLCAAATHVVLAATAGGTVARQQALMAALDDVDPSCKRDVLPGKGPTVLRIACTGHRAKAAAAAAGGYRCGATAAHRYSLLDAIKYGTKTGIYRATTTTTTAAAAAAAGAAAAAAAAAGKVVLKQFNALQYASFEGFHAFVHDRRQPRHPLINYPTAACYSAAHADSVFQAQPLLAGRNLLAFLRRRRLTWAERLDVALQIACIFEFLHAHPAGPFTFDDNHPEQYMLAAVDNKEGGGQRIAVTLIDIDTLQRAVRSSRGAGGGAAAARSNASLGIVGAEHDTRCRCFFCQGRSNCLFINTPEGTAACGQADGANANKENPAAIAPGRRCTAASDAWFLGQLLLMLVTGGPPFPGVDLAGVNARLRRGEYPAPKSGDAQYDAVVADLFARRTEPAALVRRLLPLCEAHGCAVRHCPAPVASGDGYQGFTL
jgi:hypothetical protein